MEDYKKNIIIFVLTISLVVILFTFTLFIVIDKMKATCYEELVVFKEYYYNEGFNDAVELMYNKLLVCEGVPVKFNNDTIYAINYDCLTEG